MAQVDLNPQLNSDIFSEFLCESCFQQIVEFDAFKKRVREAQQDVISEIEVYDVKLNEIRGLNESFPIDSTVEVYEEHLTEEEIIEEDLDYIEEVVEELNDVTMLENSEEIKDDLRDEEEIVYETEFEVVDEKNESMRRSNSGIKIVETKNEIEDEKVNVKVEVQGVDEYEMISTDDIIKNPERNQFCFKIYECFFCKMVRKILLDIKKKFLDFKKISWNFKTYPRLENYKFGIKMSLFKVQVDSGEFKKV